LAVDQNADDRKFKATVAQTVTLEVPIKQAQRIVLAAAVGTMSLVLRSAGDTDENAPERVSLTDLGLAPADPAPSAKTDTPAVASAPAPPPAAPAPVTRSLMPAAAPASPPPTSAWSLSSIFGTTPGAPVAKPAPEPKTVVIGVARGVDRKEYRVPAADASGAAIRPAGAAAN
jgi:Flp pilus assembly protein CpaB